MAFQINEERAIQFKNCFGITWKYIVKNDPLITPFI